MCTAAEVAHPCRLRRQRLPTAAVHEEHAGPSHSVPRNHRAPQQFGIYTLPSFCYQSR